MSDKICGCEIEQSYHCANCFTKLESDLARVTELLKESVKVIKFYGDKNNWSVFEDYEGYVEGGLVSCEDTELLEGDLHDSGGKQAREFLAKPEIKEVLKCAT